MHALDRSAFLGVELAPVPARGAKGRGPDLSRWWGSARVALEEGAGALWFRGEAPDACDPCTIAAAAVAHVQAGHDATPPLLGVVSAVPAGRHPAVLARDVTTLDIVSEGRAAAMVRWAAAGPGGSSGTALRHLGEALAVLRAVSSDEDPVFEGRFVHVAGARNLPAPRRAGGLALFVQPPHVAGATATGATAAGAASLAARALDASAAVVCEAVTEEVAMWRELLDDAAAGRLGGTAEPRPVVLCRTTLAEATTRPGAAALAAARAEGAAGVVVGLEGPRRPGAPEEVPRLAERLREAFGPWVAPGDAPGS